MTPVNTNAYVKVKLTERGLEIMRERHARLYQGVPLAPDFREPDTDEDGWSRWQLWQLMQEFGPYLSGGMRVPFETEILIDL